MLGKKSKLFAHPGVSMLKFDRILERIYERPLTRNNDDYTIEAVYSHNQKTCRLAAHSRVLQAGADGSPTVIYLPWYGGKSAHAKEFFNTKRHPDWTYLGIDIFNTREDFNNVLASAVGSQYAYALVLRMMAEQVHIAHRAGRRVGIVGISYGANVLNAYTARPLELPDAIVAVEGGNILQITLHTSYQGNESDPRTIAALEREPDLVPSQQPVAGRAASISAAVINPSDKIVIGQEELWEDAAAKLHIQGGHVAAPLLNRGKIQSFADSHLEALLMAENFSSNPL